MNAIFNALYLLRTVRAL